MSRQREVRIALLGAGKMARVHALNIAQTPGARLAIVAGGSKAPELAERYGAATAAVEAACASSEVDAVVIASPNGVHADHIELAARHDKAILVEKPVDLDLARVDACITNVGSATERCVVAFNRRFDPSFAALRQRVHAGEIGALQQLTITSRDPARPPLEYVPTSGGLFRDMTIHDFDMSRYIAGEITKVYAFGQRLDPDLAELGDYSGALVTLETATGASVVIQNSRHNPSGFDQRVEAFGAAGTLALTNPTPTLVRSSGPDHSGAGDAFIRPYAERYAASYRAEIEHLVAVTRGDAAPLANLHDGRHALALALAAAESARRGVAVSLEQ
ncbi:Gfo/Idh/MocA family protein [Gulosibacter chungangensis]|uniref:Inositol 2-dehydrogenase n=1 Tax=Gulosibacter chungangensis TaxID=979746 RepID=A0A7J5B8L0_9MICO|nr:Gfo/Idh/MocA family oxidoreductase [Gulosibacter chungangensis]KAB1641654.1 inositol 2-dehydrogenase [Gulosibacter chungangensis]